MQDGYVADIGDFVKFALLRSLTTPSGCEDPLTLGVNWYRTEPRRTSTDGGFTQYLTSSNRREKDLAELDEDLYVVLQQLVRDDRRSLEEVERTGVLGANTQFHGEVRPRHRQRDHNDYIAWHDKALDRLSSASLVLLDPDNGLENPSTRNFEKFVIDREIAGYLRRGTSLVIYQHASRRRRDLEARLRLGQVDGALAGSDAHVLGALHTSGLRQLRLFLVVAAPDHVVRLERALTAHLRRWGDRLRWTPGR